LGAHPSDREATDRARLPLSSRVRLGSEIRALLREGSHERSSHLDVFTASASSGAPRFGAVVPRYGRKAVTRNLLRRQLKEIGRIDVLPDLRRRDCAVDVLVRARPRAYAASFSELRTELLRVTEKLCSDPSSSG
jgi:ribonuclease P protein component